jgi:predicted TIM-barrel fold metal-dependent hydrolase
MTDRPIIDFRIRPATVADTPTALGGDASPYLRVYGDEIAEGTSIDALREQMQAHDVLGVVQAEYEAGTPERANRAAAATLQHLPERILAGIATADPRDADALDHLRWAHDELGLKGWIFQPGFLQVLPTDSRCFPLYAYCQEHGHPVTIHTGINFSRSGPIEFGRPLWIDHVACRFPELTIVCNHGGWPWVNELIAVLWKHDHVYADFGAVAPKYMAGDRGGWSPIAHWMGRQLAKKILLATDWPMMRYGRLLDELPELGLPEAALQRYVRGNAADLLRRFWAIDVDDRLETTAGRA